MKLETKNGQLFIDGREVKMVIFDNNTVLNFPIQKDPNRIEIETAKDNISANIRGNGNVVVQNSKNTIIGGTINTSNGFRLGDLKYE